MNANFRPRRSRSTDNFLAVPAGQRQRRPQTKTYTSPAPIASLPPRPHTMPPVPSKPLRTDQVIMRTARRPPPRRRPETAGLLQDGTELYRMRGSQRPVGMAGVDAATQTNKSTPPGRSRWGKKDKPVNTSLKTEKPARASKKKRLGQLMGIILLVGVLVFGARFYQSIARLTNDKNPLRLLNAFQPADMKNDNGRINILVAGNSADDAGHNGGDLTDSIMVLSINTKNNTAMMLSVPRDLWVKVPGDGHSKINALYANGGMSTLAKTIETELELPIHYDALVNYSAFRDLVDAVGGISITIQSEDPRGIYDSNIDYTSRRCCALAKYPNGPVTLNGKQALNLARARGDPNAYGVPYGFPRGDFDRTENQRKMLMAIKAKASSPSVIANPFKVSNLVDAVGSNVKTDLQLNEMQTLYTYMKKIDDSKIDSYNINTLKGENTIMLQNYNAGGQSALIPAAGLDDFSDIAAQIKRLFSASPVAKEAANVVLLNATDTVGLARSQGNRLIADGMSILAQGNAAANQTATTIVDNSQGKKPNTLAALKKTYSATVVEDVSTKANYPSADFIVILGANAVPKPAPASTTGQ